jgi:hypothetical protein
MRVKLCARCPYSPHDLADHHDPAAALHLCARCDHEPAMPKIYRDAYRREPCAIAPNALTSLRKSVAPSVAESLA